MDRPAPGRDIWVSQRLGRGIGDCPGHGSFFCSSQLSCQILPCSLSAGRRPRSGPAGSPGTDGPLLPGIQEGARHVEPSQDPGMTNNPPGKAAPRFKDRLEAICVEMIDKGILFSEAISQFEKCFIMEVFSRNEGNLMRAADRLGMHRNTLAKKIHHYKMNK